MMKDAGKMPELEKKWLQDLVANVANQQNIKKEMDVLSFEIPKEKIEIEYLRGKTALAQNRLDETENAIEQMRSMMAEPKRKLMGLQKDRPLIAQEYESLKEKEKDIEARLSILPKIKAEIRKLEENIGKSSDRLAALQASHQEALQRKERLGEECESFKINLLKLEDEIPVMRNTRDILGGKRPENFDVDTFETIQDDVETIVENYVNEVNGEIEQIKNEMSASNELLDAQKVVKDALLSKKGNLQQTIDELKAQIGEDKNEETLLSELAELERQKDDFVMKGEQNKQKISGLESEISSLNDRLSHEGEIDKDLKERHSNLIARKQEMGKLENVEDEIQRLEGEIQRLDRDSEANKTLHKTISNLNADVEQTKRELISSFEEYNRIFDDFEQAINGLLIDD